MGNTLYSALDPFYAALRRQSEYRPHTVAVSERIVGNQYKETTWKELFELARSFSHLPPSQPIVPMLVGRSSRCVAAMVGLMQSGRAFSCLNPELRFPHIIDILERLDAKIALIDGNGLKMIRDGIDSDDRIAMTTWIVIDDDLKKPAQRLLAKLQQHAKVIVWEASKSLEPKRDAGDGQLAGCVFTTGSNGVPKGVLLGKTDLYRRSELEVEKFYLTEQDRLLSILPFCFDVGINQTMTTLLSGCELVIVDSQLPKDILRSVAERGVTGISGMPAVWQDFINTQSSFDRNNEHASLRYITVAGADLLPAQLAHLKDIMGGGGIYKTYGQSENYSTTCLTPSEFLERPTSVGRPFREVNVYIVDKENNCLPPNTVGEIVHSGTGAMLGYLDRDQQDREPRPNPFLSEDDPNEIAIFTGDEGYLDDEGFLFLAERRDAVLKTDGNPEYPREVPQRILEFKNIADAFVVGLNDDQGHTSLTAFVVP